MPVTNYDPSLVWACLACNWTGHHPDDHVEDHSHFEYASNEGDHISYHLHWAKDEDAGTWCGRSNERHAFIADRVDLVTCDECIEARG